MLDEYTFTFEFDDYGTSFLTTHVYLVGPMFAHKYESRLYLGAFTFYEKSMATMCMLMGDMQVNVRSIPSALDDNLASFATIAIRTYGV